MVVGYSLLLQPVSVDVKSLIIHDRAVLHLLSTVESSSFLSLRLCYFHLLVFSVGFLQYRFWKRLCFQAVVRVVKSSFSTIIN